MLVKRLAVTFAAFAILTCGTNVRQVTPTIILRGHVVDASTARPLRSAIVTLPDFKTGTITDSSGVFEFRAPRPPSGRVQLVVRFIGYERFTIGVRVARDSIHEVGTIAVKPAPVPLDDLIVTSPERKPR